MYDNKGNSKRKSRIFGGCTLFEQALRRYSEGEKNRTFKD